MQTNTGRLDLEMATKTVRHCLNSCSVFDSLEPIIEGEDVYDVKEEPDDDDDCDLVGVANNDNDEFTKPD